MEIGSTSKKFTKSKFAINVVVGLFAFLAGFVLISLLLTTEASQGPSTVAGRREVLITQIKQAEEERKKLKHQIEKLREELSEIERKASWRDKNVASLRQRLDDLRFAAGLTEVEGPGVVINVSDAENVPRFASPDDYIVHDYDLRILLNALYASGAEAVSINGERISYVTAIRCVGPTIIINARRISSPFEIKAIGDPESLVKGLYLEGSSNELITKTFPMYGISFKIEKSDKVKIPSFRSSISLSYTKVVGK